MNSDLFDSSTYPTILSDSDLIVATLKFLDRVGVSVVAVDGLLVGNPSLSTRSYRDKVLNLFGNKCFVCGYSAFVDVHHVTHKVRGGLDRIDNLVVLCPNHHKEWHYIENTFFAGIGEAKDMNGRVNRAIKMDWQIPEFVLRNNIAPFLIQLARLATEK